MHAKEVAERAVRLANEVERIVSLISPSGEVGEGMEKSSSNGLDGLHDNLNIIVDCFERIEIMVHRL